MLIYRLSGLAEALNIPDHKLWTMRNAEELPHGEFVDTQGNQYYSKSQVDALRKSFENLLTRAATAKAVGICLSSFAHLVSIGVLPQPTRGLGKKKKYSKADIPEMKRLLAEYAVKPKTINHCANQAHAEGYYSIKRAAKYYGVARCTFAYWITIKRIPDPSTPYKSFRYYTKAELDGFRENQLATYFAKKAKQAKKGGK